MTTKYIYCFIRKDLDVVHQIIQLAHSNYIVGYNEGISEGPTADCCPSTCLFEVANMKELREVYDKLRLTYIPFEIFYEPTTRNRNFPIGFSSISTYPIDQDDLETREFFKQFRKYE